MVTKKRKGRAGCATCGCQSKGGYKYNNSKKRTRSRSAKGPKNVLRKKTQRRRRRRKKRTMRRKRR